MGVDINLTGIADLIDFVDNMVADLNKAMEPILQKACKPMLDDLKQKDAFFKDVSGKLRGSFKISRLKNRNKRYYIWVGDVDREAPHGWLVEMGTSRAAAKPFMGPTAERHEKQVFDDIADGLREVLGK